MAEIQPFAGVLYRGKPLESVLAPPYDVISPAYQAELYARDASNIVRVILNRSPGDAGYAEAGETYARLLKEGVLAADAQAALYLLEQRFSLDGRGYTRLGLLCRFRAEDPEKRVVLPHEHTRKGPKEDRWRVLQATRANFSPIFLMFKDAAGQFDASAARAMQAPPAALYTDDGGVAHRLWRVTDPALVAAFRAQLAGVKSYIADGHHRYATALRHRDATGPDGALTLGYFTPMDAPGLLVLPYHRILSSGPTLQEAKHALLSRFIVNEVADAATAAKDAAHSTLPYAFGLAWSGGGALVAEALPGAEDLFDAGTPACLQALDTYFFHKVVLAKLFSVSDDAVSYVHSLREAEEAVAKRECRLAAVMRGTPVRQIVDVAEAGESMPAKSTFFHPKLPSGLVIHPLVQ